MKSIKIAVGGPKKSGKTVFLGGLCENIPRDQRYLFRACPDGDATWTYKGQGSETYRRKGTFSQEVIDWYCQSLAHCELAPIVFVDIGGVPSKENRRILKEGAVTHIVLLVGDDPDTGESWKSRINPWQEFASELGLVVVAELYSDYHGDHDSVISGEGGLSAYLFGSVHHLERGEDAANRPAIQAVAKRILGLVTSPKEKTMDSTTGLIEISELAETLGKSKNERGQYMWDGSDLPKVAEILHHRSAEMPEVVRVNGAAPAYLACAITHECHPREVELNSPDGYIRVGCRKPEGSGTGIDFKVETREDGWVLVGYELNPSVPLNPEQLTEIAPPVLPMGTKIIISGRGPNWLTASLVMSYHGATKAVATFQPGVGATVPMTHSAEVELGSVIK